MHSDLITSANVTVRRFRHLVRSPEPHQSIPSVERCWRYRRRSGGSEDFDAG